MNDVILCHNEISTCFCFCCLEAFDHCNPPEYQGQIIRYVIRLPCNLSCDLSAAPTGIPTETPTKAPTGTPTKGPTNPPTATPTKSPTGVPTESPTSPPTGTPTKAPTRAPTKTPTLAPTDTPTKGPTSAPTIKYTDSPTKSPTVAPTESPTKPPTGAPTKGPTDSPTGSPTIKDTASPTKSPTSNPTGSPTSGPTKEVCIAVNQNGFGEVNVDGNIDEWDASDDGPDFIGNLYEAGDSGKVIAGKLYARLECSTSTLCIMVNSMPTTTFHNEAWFKNYDIQQHPLTPLGNGIVPVMVGDTFVAWKACYYIPLGTMNNFEVHTNFCTGPNDNGCGNTGSTGRGETSICMEAICSPGATPAPIPATSNATTSPTASPTSGPTVATGTPTTGPTAYPTSNPTSGPTSSPTRKDTGAPTDSPTSSPTIKDTEAPTTNPTSGPTEREATGAPTTSPTKSPTTNPTTSPTSGPTEKEATLAPTTTLPTSNPTSSPTVKEEDIGSPTTGPTKKVTSDPTATPTSVPTSHPTTEPPAGLAPPSDTNEPTIAPTLAPAPAVSPITPTTPTVCVDEDEMAYIQTIGVDVELPEGAVQVISRTPESISFVVHQLWNTGSELIMLSVHHHPNTIGETNCDMNINVPPISSMEYTTTCVEGIAEIDIVVYVGSDSSNFNVAECDACDTPEPTSTDMVHYYIELNCNPIICDTNPPTPSPTLSPVDTSCPENIELIIQDGSTMFDIPPIQILNQDTTSVTFRVIQSWVETQLRYIFVQYDDLILFQQECYAYDNVTITTSQIYTAYCWHHVPITLVDIWIMDPTELIDGVDIAEVPRCCHPPDNVAYPAVHYVFKVWCVSQCPPPDGDGNVVGVAAVDGDETIPPGYGDETIPPGYGSGRKLLRTTSTSENLFRILTIKK